MPIEYKPHRASSRALAHLDGLLDQALERTFPASDAVAIDVEPESHEHEARVPIPAVRWLATEVARGPRRNTNAHHQRSSATAKMRVNLSYAANLKLRPTDMIVGKAPVPQ
jgi:hypothetical protein